MGITYEHICRDCDHEWLDEHPLEDLDAHRQDPCPACDMEDTYIAVTTSAAVVFNGPGWSPTGYNKHTALDSYKKQGVTVYDKKEDHDREVRGEAEEAELKKLKHEDTTAKKVFGSDAGITQNQADARVKQAGQERVDGPK